MTRTTFRILAAFLFVLLAANGLRYWISHRSAAHQPPGFPGGPGGPGEPPPFDDAMQERFKAMIARLPEEKRQIAEERFAADRAFFESVRALPADERRQKMQEYFARNPPPPGLDLPPPGGLPPGAPDGAEAGGGAGSGQSGLPGRAGRVPRIPEPGIRQSLDTQIINAQKNAAP